MKYCINEKRITATVQAVRWERIHLYLDVKVLFASEKEKEGELCFYAVNQLYYAQAEFQILSIENDIYHLKLNIANNGENVCVPSGMYKIFVCKENDILADCEVTKEVIEHFPEYSRTFLLIRGTRCYTVAFSIEEDAETLPFRLRTMYAAREEMEFPENTGLLENLDIVGSLKASWASKKRVLRTMYRFFRMLYKGKREKTILFMSEQNTVIASNLKAVSQKMIERGMDKEYQLLYSARSAAASSQSIKSWIELIQKIAKSSTIIIDDHAPILDWLRLSEDTKLIQLWHAGAGFKSSGYSRWGQMGGPGPVSCHRQYSYGIAGSKKIRPFFSEVWGINDEQILPTGMPRMDEFLREDYRKAKTEELYEKYAIFKGKKVILFAPTYRGRNKRLANYPYELIDFKGLYEACKEEYVVAFKMHPWVSTKVPIPKEYKDKFIDLGKYPNINDLFYITDLLITDYSSNIFEYSLMRKPMMFFAYDKVQYSLSRGFHRDYEESAPGKVCYTFAELLEAFRNRDFEYEKVEEYVEHHFDYIDSNASDRVIDWLILGNIPKDLQADIDRVRQKNERRKSLDFLPEGIIRGEDGKLIEEEI
ncbi:MAG: CDP-glycerol glycerophosphotransferase family protein [Lachnospiraceae bacterium]|nr:CDP-glycerol glycerophosphotransferase family protein [Lachnospiraceae bacterium]